MIKIDRTISGKNKGSISFFIGYFLLIFSLILINTISALGAMPEALALYMRSAVHLMPIATFLFLLILQRERLLGRVVGGFSIRMSIAICLIPFMVISGLLNGYDLESLGRFVLLVIHILNLFVLLPLALNYIDREKTLFWMSKGYVWLMALLCLFILFIYFTGASEYNRLGYPYMPGVFGYMCLIALIISITVYRSQAWGLFYLVNIFMSGSRSALVLSIAVYVLVILYRLSVRRMMIGFMVLTVLSLAFISMSDFSRPFLVERDDLSSGRVDIWKEAVTVMLESPYFGYNRKQTFNNDEYEGGLASHNSFLDLAVQYGIFFGVFSYVIWLIYGFNVIGIRRREIEFLCAASLFLVVTIKSFITNIFWTNLGDGSTYLAVIVI